MRVVVRGLFVRTLCAAALGRHHRQTPLCGHNPITRRMSFISSFLRQLGHLLSVANGRHALPPRRGLGFGFQVCGEAGAYSFFVLSQSRMQPLQNMCMPLVIAGSLPHTTASPAAQRALG